MKDSYRIDELADRWDVSKRTVERLIQKGELTAIKIGQCTRVTSETLSRFENKENKVRQGPPGSVTLRQAG